MSFNNVLNDDVDSQDRKLISSLFHSIGATILNAQLLCADSFSVLL